MPAPLSSEIQEHLKKPGYAALTTLGRDGSPHLTQVWVDTDGTHVIVNTVEGYQKLVNMRRDPRVSVLVRSAEDPARWFSIMGEVIEITTEGAKDHVEMLSWRNHGAPYDRHHYGQRVLVKIAPTRVFDALRRGGVQSATPGRLQARGGSDGQGSSQSGLLSGAD